MIDAKKLIKEYSLTPNKALGQNFLVDENALMQIVGFSRCEGAEVLEIGPGLGALTNELAGRAKNVVAVEIDKRMCELLKRTLSGHKNTHIINGDILKLKNDELTSLFSGEFIVAANLPYYITSQTAMKFIDSDLPIKHMVLMMQQEAAAHFIAGVKEKCYTPVSVISNRYFEMDEALRLSPASYYPAPAVNSSVLVFKRKDAPYDKGLSRLIKAAFSMRRKTLKNNLSAILPKASVDEIILNAGLAPVSRAEELTSDDFVRLTESARLILGADAI